VNQKLLFFSQVILGHLIPPSMWRRIRSLCVGSDSLIFNKQRQQKGNSSVGVFVLKTTSYTVRGKPIILPLKRGGNA